MSPQSESAWAYAICSFSLSCPAVIARFIALSASVNFLAAIRIFSCETETNKSLTVEPSRTVPINWRITPKPPEIATFPFSGAKSPEIILTSVVLPEPFGPISATLAPSPTRNETSFRSTRPSESEYSIPITSICPIIINTRFYAK
ncbi:unannotated protein [freshwater metagenome]|uniref:Unannotated protein n=1 Tax=freshwater metagenome TaxID=449393 RepID=A0A6J7PU59_9ZZZZ